MNAYNVVFVLILCIALALAIQFFYKQKFGHIIFLNGTSSSGKSALIQELQKIYPEAKVVKIDDWMPAEIEKKAREFGWDSTSGMPAWGYLHQYMYQKTQQYYFDIELRKQLFDLSSFYQHVKNLAQQGNLVIVDTVLEYEEEFKRALSILTKNVTWVLVYCPLDILLARVESRNTAANKAQEQRVAFLAFEEFINIYKIHAQSDEPIIDVVSSNVLRKSITKAADDLMALMPPDILIHYKNKIDAFIQKFIKEFRLDEQATVSLSPTHAYDLILNSGTYASKDLAKEIRLKLRSKHYILK